MIEIKRQRSEKQLQKPTTQKGYRVVINKNEYEKKPMSNYQAVQQWRRRKYGITKTNYPRYDSNGNCIFYEDIDYDGNIIQNYKEFDNLNRVIHYKNSKGLDRYITYFSDTTKVIREVEYYIDNGLNTRKEIVYDDNGNKTEVTYKTGNKITCQNWNVNERNRLYYENIFYSPFEIV